MTFSWEVGLALFKVHVTIPIKWMIDRNDIEVTGEDADEHPSHPGESDAVKWASKIEDFFLRSSFVNDLTPGHEIGIVLAAVGRHSGHDSIEGFHGMSPKQADGLGVPGFVDKCPSKKIRFLRVIVNEVDVTLALLRKHMVENLRERESPLRGGHALDT